MYDDYFTAIALQAVFDLPQRGDDAIDLGVPGVGHEMKSHPRACSLPTVPLRGGRAKGCQPIGAGQRNLERRQACRYRASKPGIASERYEIAISDGS
jgi:hypothetical protein